MAMPRTTQLPPHLRDLRQRIEGYARGFGLDLYETTFEVLGYDELNMVAAYGGFPTRYPHWRFGMEYDRLSKGYEYGLSRIYELVINNDPATAYLLSSNMDVDQKLVMAHVFGHVDFFKNNYMFQHTDRKMMDAMANHATRIRRHQDRLGVERVEGLIDRCLSLENLIDYQAPYVKRRPSRSEAQAAEDAPPQVAHGLRADREYMREFINPPGFVEEQQRRLDDAAAREHQRFPAQPERDVLRFLLEHAPLERWEHEVLSIVRDEAYYFAPQGLTKIMNEGWATYWHSRIMTEKALEASELIDYADHHSGALATSGMQLNPYRLGVALWRDIEDRWNKGRFGKAWDQCDTLAERRAWDLGLGQGQQKLFEVRRHYSDVSFIDEFLTLDFCAEQQLFTFGYTPSHARWEIQAREFKAVKLRLLHQLTNFGQPQIAVEDGNFENRGELLLAHHHDGLDLKLDWAFDTLRALQTLWRRPVNLRTVAGGRATLLRDDGHEHSQRPLDH
jgi:stage V sporulation protein R